MPYQVERVDLAQLGAASSPLATVGTDVTQVHVLQLAADKQLALRFGKGSQAIPLFAGLQLTPCDPQDRTQGLYIEQPGGATAGEAVVLIWTGSGSSAGNP